MGAAGLIIVSEASRKFWKMSARINEKLGYKPVSPSFWADPYHPDLPVIMIHPDIFKAYFPQLEISVENQNYPEPYFFNSDIQFNVEVENRVFNAPNVAGYINGSDYENEEVIILSAHLDHIGTDGNDIFNGANDNASSCSVLLEIAKELVNNPPERTVIFVFYTAEEPCLWGSQYFISHYNFNKENILVNINVEMCGKRDKGNRGTTAIGPVQFEKYFGKLRPISCEIILIANKYKQRYSGSDQLSFYRQGLPAIRFGNMDYPEKHTSRDDISIIDFKYLSEFAETLFSV